MSLWGLVATAGLLGMAAGHVLTRAVSARAGLLLGMAAVALGVLLILLGRAEQGWGGLGMVAVASVLVAPFAAGCFGGIGLARLTRRR